MVGTEATHEEILSIEVVVDALVVVFVGDLVVVTKVVAVMVLVVVDFVFVGVDTLVVVGFCRCWCRCFSGGGFSRCRR